MKISKKSLRLEASVTDEFIHRYLQALDCPRALSVWILYKSNQHSDIVKLESKPHDYDSCDRFRGSYLATQFLRKASFLRSGIDTEAVGLEGFETSEAKCKETNRRWLDRRFENADWNAIHRVSRKILAVLGPSPNIEAMVNSSSWGPGASLSIKRRESSSFKKYRDERGITIGSAELIPLIDACYPHLAGRMFQWEVGDRVVVVPKDSRTDRVILIQPGWNLWFQLGLGQVIRKKLLFDGLDINGEAEVYNRETARSSSITGEFATIDFHAASDQIAIEPLREILPPQWFRLLDLLRSNRSNTGRRWEKFSSMGNGFTFELETLVFWSIAHVACDMVGCSSDGISVFGDDVILPVSAYPSFQRISALFGFTINEAKTFVDSPFRESCGEHYYNGVDCKPIFLKEKISVVHHAFKFYNQVRELAHRHLGKMACDVSFRSVCNFLKASVPPVYRKCRIPLGKGDIGFLSNFDEARPASLRDGHQGFSTLALVSIPITFATEEAPLLLVRLTEHSDIPRLNAVEVKSRTRPALKRVRVFEWYNLGPWEGAL